MPKKHGTQLPALRPEEWIGVLAKLGYHPQSRDGSHVYYRMPGFSPYYVVYLNWPTVHRSQIRRVLQALSISEERLWEVL